MNASRFLGPQLCSSSGSMILISLTPISFLSPSTSKPYYSPIIFTSSPNSSLFPSPNKIGTLHRSGSNLICFQQSGVTDDKSEHEGVVIESVSNGMYSVSLGNGNTILGYVSGKIRQRSIQILPGDKVRIELNRYDSSKGRITYRTTNQDNVEKTDVPKNKAGKNNNRGRRN